MALRISVRSFSMPCSEAARRTGPSPAGTDEPRISAVRLRGGYQGVFNTEFEYCRNFGAPRRILADNHLHLFQGGLLGQCSDVGSDVTWRDPGNGMIRVC